MARSASLNRHPFAVPAAVLLLAASAVAAWLVAANLSSDVRHVDIGALGREVLREIRPPASPLQPTRRAEPPVQRR
jgi:hypothetical protein